MKIYLAARYQRRLELICYRHELNELGHVVTSRWLDVDGSNDLNTYTPGVLRKFADDDICDLCDANCCISFTEPPDTTMRGSRHVEFGVALARRYMRLIVVGYRENLFHWMSDVEFFPTWEACLAALMAEQQEAA